MNDTWKNVLPAVGAVLAALGASLCCILPVAVAVLGVGSAALAARLDPLRPWLAGLTFLLLGTAFYRAYRPVKCAPGQACSLTLSRRGRVALWLVAAAAVALTAFPYYVSWLF